MKRIVIIFASLFVVLSHGNSQTDTLKEMRLIDSMFTEIFLKKDLLEKKRVPFDFYSKELPDTATYYFQNGQFVLFELITIGLGDDGMGLPPVRHEWAFVLNGTIRFYNATSSSKYLAPKIEDTKKYLREYREYYDSKNRRIADMSKSAEGNWERADSIFNNTPWEYHRISKWATGNDRLRIYMDPLNKYLKEEQSRPKESPNKDVIFEVLPE